MRRCLAGLVPLHNASFARYAAISCVAAWRLLCYGGGEWKSTHGHWQAMSIALPERALVGLSNLCWGQLDPKRAAFSKLRFETDFPAHSLDGLAGDGQPDAVAFVILGQLEPF